MTAKAEIERRLTRDEAQDAGLIPPHQSWDEEQQRAVPIGMAVMADALARPVDLTQQMDQFKKNRDAVMKFVKDYLVESEYDQKNGLPVPGKVGDYYKVPGSEQKALTKRGASKIAQLFRWSRGAARQVAATETKEFCSATIEVPLVDQYGRVVGAGVASCNTAEAGFRGPGAVKKYGGWGEWKDKQFTVTREPDLRAAQNDVVARAAKRAFVQATIVAAAIEEIFTAAAEEEREAEPVQSSAFKMPESSKLGAMSGRLITEIAAEDLKDLRDRMKAKMKDPGTWQPVLDAIDLELDRRRDDKDGF